MKIGVNAPCPCGSGKKYKKCCRIYHKGALAEDAPTLMKSRFSAFAAGEAAYIVKTSTFQDDIEALRRYCEECEFERLEIIDSSQTSVTFKATLTCNGEDASFSEKSYFVYKEGRWYYDTGEIL